MTRQRAARVRLATPADVPAMAVVERSAAARFRTLPELAWLADGEPIAAADQLAWIAAGTAWVATDPDDAPVGLLDAEVFGTALHVWELSVHRSWQGRGIGRAVLDAAIGHVKRHGTGHTEAIVTGDLAAAREFTGRIDAADIGAFYLEILRDAGGVNACLVNAAAYPVLDRHGELRPNRLRESE